MFTFSEAEYSRVQHSTVQHSTAEYSRVQQSTAEYSTVKHSTAEYSTVQHSTAEQSRTKLSGIEVQENELTYKISTLLKKKHKLLSGPDIVVLVCDRISDVSGEITPMAKILHCTRQT